MTPAPPVAPASSFEVGYCKPPVHSRFQKGQSGNPKGRKKGSKNLDTIVLGILNERIAVNTPTGRRNISRIEVLIRKLIETGGKGNVRAIDQLVRHYTHAQASATAQVLAASEPASDVTETDTASLALLRAILMAEMAGDRSAQAEEPI